MVLQTLEGLKKGLVGWLAGGLETGVMIYLEQQFMAGEMESLFFLVLFCGTKKSISFWQKKCCC